MYEPGITEVRAVQESLRLCNHEITYDWTTQSISETGDDDERRALAEAERNGILSADLLILLDHNRLRGALIEMGMALGNGKETIVFLEPGRTPSLFYHLPYCTIITSRDNLLRAIELLPDDPCCRQCGGTGYFERSCAEEEDAECWHCGGQGCKRG